MKLIILIAIIMLVHTKYPSFNPDGPSKKYKKFVTHPQAKSSRLASSVNFPHPTNSWFQNFLQGSQESPVNLYSVYVAAKETSFKISILTSKLNLI